VTSREKLLLRRGDSFSLADLLADDVNELAKVDSGTPVRARPCYLLIPFKGQKWSLVAVTCPFIVENASGPQA